GRQFEPGRPHLLRRLDDGVRADLVVAGSRCRAWRAGRRGQASRGHHRRRVPQCQTRRRDAVQHDPRSATVIPRSWRHRTITLREASMLVKREWMLVALLLTAPMTAAAGNVITDWDEKAVGIVQTGTVPPPP